MGSKEWQAQVAAFANSRDLRLASPIQETPTHVPYELARLREETFLSMTLQGRTREEIKAELGVTERGASLIRTRLIAQGRLPAGKWPFIYGPKLADWLETQLSKE
jgi:hypothetical protein